MAEIPLNCIVRLSMLMDRNRAPSRAHHVVDTMSFGKALVQVQEVFQHLVVMENIVRDGFKAPHPCAYPARYIVGWVRLRHRRRVEIGPADNLGWNVLHLVHIIDMDARDGGFTQWLQHSCSFSIKSLVCCNITMDEAYLNSSC